MIYTETVHEYRLTRHEWYKVGEKIVLEKHIKKVLISANGGLRGVLPSPLSLYTRLYEAKLHAKQKKTKKRLYTVEKRVILHSSLEEGHHFCLTA